MNIKLYGATEQKKLATYPDRIAKAQALQSAIPNIQELNLDDTQKLKDRMQRYGKELLAYQVSMEAALRCYKSIISDGNTDCDKMEKVIQDAPKNTDPSRLFSLTTSIVQTKQQLVFIEQQCISLSNQIESVKAARAAISASIEQNKLANLAEMLLAIKKRDIEIHQK
jgi:TPP-dependent 2-oxoacid decarboxylase